MFLHGLTFDRTMWNPIVELLPANVQWLTVDLPGHGGSSAQENYDLERVVDLVHDAVLMAGLDSPTIVGHSISGIFATIYAARHPARAVVNVDQVLDVRQFVELAHTFEPALRGPNFAEIWSRFQDSMHLELIPLPQRDAVLAGMRASQDLVLGYWSTVLMATPDELLARIDEILTHVLVPYDVVHGSDPGVDYRTWLGARLPQAAVQVWDGCGHFPHLVHPHRFAAFLTAKVTHEN